MAKSKSFWGLRRGSAGSLTFSKSSKGEQITRAKITSMKNPQTAAQNVQRMTFAGLAKARARWNPIVNHSFEGETPKISSLSMFTKKNLAYAGTGLYVTDPNDWDFAYGAQQPSAPVAYKGGGGVPCKIIISDGSLPGRSILGTQGASNLVDELLSFSTAEGATTPTFAELFAAAGIAVGDWLTFCLEFWDADTGVISDDFVHTTWVRFKVKADGVNVQAVISNMSNVFDVEQGGDAVELSYGMMTVGTRRGVGINVPALADTHTLSLVALIHSRNTENQRKRSRAVLDFWNNGTFPGLDTMAGLENALSEAVGSWQIDAAYILDGGYETYDAMAVPNWYEFQQEHGVPRPRPVPANPGT